MSRLTSMLKVVVDGFPMANLYDVTVEHGTFNTAGDFEAGALYREQPSNVRAKLTSRDDTVITFRVQGYEQVGDTLYFYGPLRNSFPEMFTGIDPVEWQVEYLIATRRPSLDRFKLRKDDAYFNTPEAQLFRKGYEIGYKVGNQAKPVVTPADAMQGLTKATQNAAKATAEFNGILGQAFNRKQGN